MQVYVFYGKGVSRQPVSLFLLYSSTVFVWIVGLNLFNLLNYPEVSSPNRIDYPPLTVLSRDHLATITDVYVTSLSSHSPFPLLRPLVPDFIRLSLLAIQGDGVTG